MYYVFVVLIYYDHTEEKKMKKIVIYKSKTGFAEKYAEWIAKALECEAEELKNISSKKLQDYDIILK